MSLWRRPSFGKSGTGSSAWAVLMQSQRKPEVARAARTVRSTMTRLHAEVMRSISHYRAQQGGSAPERVFLCGGGASLPFVREFFQEKLGVPVEFFHPLRNVAAGPALATADLPDFLLGEAVGLALRATTTCPMELNLQTARTARAQTLARQRPFYLLAAVCVLLGLLGWSAYFVRGAALARRVAESAGEKAAGLQKIASAMDSVRKESLALEAVGLPLTTAVRERGFWVEVIEDLNLRLPKENIWITELVGTSGGKPVGLGAGTGRAASSVTPPPVARAGKPAPPAAPVLDGLFVRGLYLTNPKQQEVVVDFFRELVKSPLFVIDPRNQAKVIRPSSPNEREWAFPYELRLDLKHPLALP